MLSMHNSARAEVTDRTGPMIKQFAKGLFNALGIPTYLVRENYRELQAAFVRIHAAMPWQRSKVRQIVEQDVVRLNFGCGLTRYAGWHGVDQFFGPTVDLTIDLRRPLPFPNGSVSYCFSEHFLEHLYPDEALAHLREVRRILKDGGRYRIVVPDVLKFADRYLKGDVDFFRRAFPWEDRPLHAFYAVANFRGEHRSIFDYSELEHLSQLAGFSRALRSTANASEIEDLHIDKGDPQRIEESFYVELVR
jgi:predicted SAM-dependent methyltransferase